MLPSAAEMPPCAATVWLRVGKTLVMQAVDRPASARPERRAQTRAAGADHDDVVGVIDEFVVFVHVVEVRRAPAPGSRTRRSPRRATCTNVDSSSNVVLAPLPCT